MAYPRVSAHPAIFNNPLAPADAWGKIHGLLNLHSSDFSYSAGFTRTRPKRLGAVPLPGVVSVIRMEFSPLLFESGVIEESQTVVQATRSGLNSAM